MRTCRSEVRSRFARRALRACIVGLGVAQLCAIPAAAQTTGTLTGRVTAGADTIAGVRIVVQQSGDTSNKRQATTDAGGMFRLDGIAAGPHLVIATRVGFAPSIATISVPAGGATHVSLALTALPRALDTVMVSADPQVPLKYGADSRLHEFYSRRKRGRGRFFTRAELDSLGTHDLAGALRRVPGLRVRSSPGGVLDVVMARCATPVSLGKSSGTVPQPPSMAASTGEPEEDQPVQLAVFIDGVRVLKRSNGEVLGTVKLEEIEAVEVYRGASELPAEAAGNACAAIYIWTRFGVASAR